MLKLKVVRGDRGNNDCILITLDGCLEQLRHSTLIGHRELIIEKAKKFMKDMYPVDTPDFTFSIGWLGKFKARYEIKISGVLERVDLLKWRAWRTN
ncbi:CENP-B homolog protein 2-like protein [Tanacetum coccineum]